MSDQRIPAGTRQPAAGAVRPAPEAYRLDTDAQTVPDLAGLLRQLRRREARQQGETPLTYRQLAARTGWSRG